MKSDGIHGTDIEKTEPGLDSDIPKILSRKLYIGRRSLILFGNIGKLRIQGVADVASIFRHGWAVFTTDSLTFFFLLVDVRGQHLDVMPS